MDSYEIIADSMAGAAADLAQHRFRRRMADIEGRCQSPIEKVMLGMILLATEFSGWFPYGWVSHEDYCWPNETRKEGPTVYLQAGIGDYRADFLVTVKNNDGANLFGVIECDGHDFHERTKQQASRDKTRDRWMTSNGIRVFRFSGSEIWNESQRCMGEILRAIDSLR